MITRFVKKLVFSILLIYGFDLIMQGFNVLIPINYFNILVIIMLGFPGLIALAISFFFFIERNNMKQDFIEYLELCVREKKLSHAFLVETNNQEELLNKIYNLLKHENLVANLKIENNTDIAVIEPENNIIDKDKILNIQNKFLTMSFNNTLKVYFIKSAEKMNLSASNKLLKFLEEPNENIIGILFTSDINIILPTIRSRCEIFNTKKTNMDDPEIQEITDNLKKLINNNRYDIMLYIRSYKNLEKEKLSKALEILINQIDDIQLNDKYNRMLEINKAILWLNSSVNIELVLAKIAKALGR